LGDPIPLVWSNITLPPDCTLFKTIQTHVYYPKDENMVLAKNAQKELKEISKKISDQKNS
jgi:hypothetical protein